MINLYWLPDDPKSPFPPLEQALIEPDGLLAAGGDLSTERLINAYQRGIFPWFNEGEPILWWSPNPRCVLYPDQLKVSRSLRKTLRKKTFEIRMDSAFTTVVKACAAPRTQQQDTWITDTMLNAYINMHTLGYAHSVECWQQNELVGGLYGIAIGQVFFGESMFSKQTDASKVALVHLCDYLQQGNFKLIDVQVHTPHMQSMGAEMIARTEFEKLVKKYATLKD
jgi:leucyl/phenylalanyl-tRNA--protein transferase